MLDNKLIEIICGDGRKGYKKEAPFDCIHVGAAAQPDVPAVLCEQLREGLNHAKICIFFNNFFDRCLLL